MIISISRLGEREELTRYIEDAAALIVDVHGEVRITREGKPDEYIDYKCSVVVTP
jgi:hypothetical protein